ncbi:CASP 4A3 [Olea europaea subsp. europaea]|uniref:CASP-like protein n=1 Tax=Olea europaea subsp. europaea TaxID=158383 RepID=A0A8S0TB88_OLEEU|nr:CASP 4A3 [Olea europaea subsp. europaea]
MFLPLPSQEVEKKGKLLVCKTQTLISDSGDKNMEPQNKQHTPIDSESTAVSTPHKVSVSDSSPPHSKQNSGEHISLSPPAGNSPGRSSISSDRTTLTHGSSPREDKSAVPPPETKSPPMNSSENHPAFVNWSVVAEPMEIVSKTDPGGPDGKSGKETSGGPGGGGGSGRRRPRPALSVLRRTKRENMVKKAALGFRIFGFLFCLVSFSLMAADRNQGWALDSFERYKEFRYCMSVNVIGFVYSGAQALDLSYNLATRKYIMQHQQQRRYYFNFTIDQASFNFGCLIWQRYVSAVDYLANFLALFEGSLLFRMELNLFFSPFVVVITLYVTSGCWGTTP